MSGTGSFKIPRKGVGTASGRVRYSVQHDLEDVDIWQSNTPARPPIPPRPRRDDSYLVSVPDTTRHIQSPPLLPPRISSSFIGDYEWEQQGDLGIKSAPAQQNWQNNVGSVSHPSASPYSQLSTSPQQDWKYNYGPISPPGKVQAQPTHIQPSTYDYSLANKHLPKFPTSGRFNSFSNGTITSNSVANDQYDPYEVYPPTIPDTNPTIQEFVATTWPKQTYPIEIRHSLPTPNEDGDFDDPYKYLDVRKGDLPAWKPKSLRKPFLFGMAVYIMFCATIYVILSVFLNSRKGYIVTAGPKINWLLRWGPLVLAQFLSEWVARIVEDHTLIDPYCELSRFTLAKKAITSRFKTSSFKKSLLPPRSTFFQRPNRYQILYYFCTFFLFNYQAALFTQTMKIFTEPEEVSFVGVSANSLLEAYNGTTFGPSMMQAMYHGVDGNNVALNTSLWTVFTQTPGVSSTVILPFQPSDPTAMYESISVMEATLWESRGSAIAIGMNCSQVNTMKYTISPSSSGDFNTIQAVLTDQDGCVFNHEDVLLSPQGQNNVMISVWDQLKGNDKGSSTLCPQFRQFAYAGRVPVDALYSSSKTTLNSTWSRGKGAFGAISCDPYFKNYEDLPVIIYRKDSREPITIGSRIATGSKGDYAERAITDLSPYKAKALPGLSQVFASSLSSTIFLANLTKDLVDPVIGKTFWGETIDSAYMPWYDANSNANWSCSAIREFGDSDWKADKWTSDQACMLYGGVKGIYVSVASLTAGSVAQFIPKDKKITGKLSFERSVWVLESTIAFVSLAIHAIALALLIPIYTHLRKLVTGLYGNPASLAAKMFYFRNKNMRDLFSGLDAYAAKDSVACLAKRMDASTFKWQVKKLSAEQEMSDRRGWVFIRRNEAKKPAPDAWLLPSELPPLNSTRFSEVPTLMRPIALIGVQLFIAVLAGAIFGSIFVQGRREGYPLWVQNEFGLSAFFNRNMFSWIPAITLTILRVWWGEIDKFFRQAQPFEQLKDSAQGSTSLCTQYLTQPDFFITWKAWRQRHRKLAFVTAVTLVAKIAIVASGRLFEFELGWVSGPALLSTTADWRKGTFSPIGNISIWDDIQRQTLAGSMSSFPKLQGWSVGRHSFMPVDIPIEGKNYTATLDSISSSLDCSEIRTELKSGSSNGIYKAWSIAFSSKVCSTGSVPLDICNDVFISSKKEITSSRGGCYTWNLLPETSCNGVADFWLISAAESPSPISFQRSNVAESGQLFFSAQPKVLSMLCRPKYTKDTVSTSIIRSGVDVSLTPIRTITSEPLETSRFMSQDSLAMDFSSYFAGQLNSSSLVSKVYLAASGVAINPMSAIMIFNMTAGITDFQSFPAISTAASRAYSMVFSAFTNVLIDSSPFLFQPINPSSDPNPPTPKVIEAQISYQERRAIPQIERIWIVTAALLIYGGSIFLLIWWHGAVALPQDVTSLGGQMILLYGNTVMREIEKQGSYDVRWEDLRDGSFKLGVFQDREGGEHLGVDVAENVDVVPTGGARGELRRRFGF